MLRGVKEDETPSLDGELLDIVTVTLTAEKGRTMQAVAPQHSMNGEGRDEGSKEARHKGGHSC